VGLTVLRMTRLSWRPRGPSARAARVGRARVEQPPQQKRLRSRQLRSHRLEPLADERDDVHRRLPAVERSQQVAELAHRAALDAEGAVTAGAAHVRAQPAHLLLGDLDRIEGLARDPLRRAAELAQGVLRAAEGAGMLLGEKARAHVAAVLLVAQDHELQRGRRPGLVRRDEGRDAHRDAALHVERAAPPDVVVDELGAERRLCPLLAGRRDDVDVAVEHERRAAVRARVARDQVRASGDLLDALGLDAAFAKQRLDIRDAGLLVPRRVRRVEADQVTQELDGVDHSSSSAASRRSTSAVVL